MSFSSPWNGDAPLIVRISGIPASAIEEFSSHACSAALRDAAQLREDLFRCRSEMVDRLHKAIPGSPTSLRHLFLTVKRDCFNGREIGRHRSSANWPSLERVAGGLAGRILELEQAMSHWEERFTTLYQQEHDDKVRLLVDLAADCSFRRGLALASPLLVQSLDRLRQQSAFGRKERKLQESLLRYVSRAALKLSPFSTFTRLTLGLVRNGIENDAVRLLGARWTERSILRLKRYLLEQYVQTLLRYPPFRNRLPVELNDTIEEISPGRYRFLRAGFRGLDEESGKMRYFHPSLVKIDLSPSLMSRIQAALDEPEVSLHTFGTRLEQSLPEGGAASDVDQTIGQLLRIDFLQSVLPWRSNEVHLERAMLAYLRTLPRCAELDVAIAGLERIASLELGFSSAEAPEQVVKEIDGLLGDIWQAIATLGELGQAAEYARGKRIDVYEDVFLIAQASHSSTQQELVQISRESAEMAIHSIEPLVGLSALYCRRYDFLTSLNSFAARKWPGQQEVGIMEVFSDIQPLWREHLRLQASSFQNGTLRETFNPLGLPRLEELARLREDIWGNVTCCIHSVDGESQICRETLATVLREVPKGCRPLVGPCLFLQPADVLGTLWVLNGLFEGTGRYSSRYTIVMPHVLRQAYAEHMTVSSRLEQDGEEVELLDMMCTQGDTLNIHVPQTPHILEIPGESSDVSVTRKLRLRDLRIRFSGDLEELPILVDLRGRRYIPVHLGGTNLRYMPVLLKFLSLFGPGDLKPAVPRPLARLIGEVTVLERLRMGNVILRRQRWIVPVKSVFDKIYGMSDAAAFAALNHWRHKLGIPDRVFVIEKVPHDYIKEFYKPQYVDFTSPLFLSLFRSVLASSLHQLFLDEMLPTPEAYPSDADGTRWGVEVQLDSLALRSASVWSLGQTWERDFHESRN